MARSTYAPNGSGRIDLPPSRVAVSRKRPGTHVEFNRRGRLDATITLPDVLRHPARKHLPDLVIDHLMMPRQHRTRDNSLLAIPSNFGVDSTGTDLRMMQILIWPSYANLVQSVGG